MPIHRTDSQTIPDKDIDMLGKKHTFVGFHASDFLINADFNADSHAKPPISPVIDDSGGFGHVQDGLAFQVSYTYFLKTCVP